MAEIIIETHGIPELQTAFTRAPQEVSNEMRATMEVATGILHREVVENTPVGATGLARRSMTTDISGSGIDLHGRVFSRDDAVKIASLEGGRAPGKMPPIAPIELWVRRKFGGDRSAAFLVARAIGRRGTKGAKMFERAYDARKPEVERLFETRIQAVITRVFR